MRINMTLKLYTSFEKGLKLKGNKFWGANSYVSRSYKGKTAPFPPILNRVKTLNYDKIFCVATNRIFDKGILFIKTKIF